MEEILKEIREELRLLNARIATSEKKLKNLRDIHVLFEKELATVRKSQEMIASEQIRQRESQTRLECSVINKINALYENPRGIH